MAKRAESIALSEETRAAFLRCLSRTPGHNWNEVPTKPRRGVVRPIGERVSFGCSSCTSLRHDIFSMATGELLYRDYEYPPGYSMKLFWDNMDERPTPTLIRVQYLRERRRAKRSRRG